MARTLRHASHATVTHAMRALALLKQAREELAKADAPQALARVRAAITSTDGAVRHAQRRAASTLEN